MTAFPVAKPIVGILAALPLCGGGAFAEETVSGPPVVLSCSTTKKVVIAGIATQATRHFQAPGDTVDEAEARFQLNWGGDDFASCSGFRAIWRDAEGVNKEFSGENVDDLVRQLADAGAPIGAVAKWKLDRRQSAE